MEVLEINDNNFFGVLLKELLNSVQFVYNSVGVLAMGQVEAGLKCNHCRVVDGTRVDWKSVAVIPSHNYSHVKVADSGLQLLLKIRWLRHRPFREFSVNEYSK